MFCWILIFDLNWGFCKGYSLCIMAGFQNGLIDRILNDCFCTEQLFKCFRNFLILLCLKGIPLLNCFQELLAWFTYRFSFSFFSLKIVHGLKRWGQCSRSIASILNDWDRTSSQFLVSKVFFRFLPKLQLFEQPPYYLVLPRCICWWSNFECCWTGFCRFPKLLKDICEAKSKKKKQTNKQNETAGVSRAFCKFCR